MNNVKNYFKKSYTAVQKWYRERATRRVFFVSILVAVALFILSTFVPIDFLFLAGVVFVGIAVCASAADTFQSKKLFETTVIKIEHEARLRDMQPWSEEDIKEIKRKKLSFIGTILLKIIFLIILIALLI